jgi:hypothetical protein
MRSTAGCRSAECRPQIATPARHHYYWLLLAEEHLTRRLFNGGFGSRIAEAAS